MMQKFRVSSIDIKRCTMRVRPGWVNRGGQSGREELPSASDCNQIGPMPKLIIRPETGEPTSHDLVEETYTIGRSPENSVRLEDASVSGRHAEIIVVAKNCYLKDLGSTNGTLINGQAITEAQLRAGDRIRFGKVEASFDYDIPVPARPLPHPMETDARPAAVSARPADFTNASPFPSRATKKDPIRIAVFAAVALAFAAFIASIIALAMMKAPGF